jgi:hypothetical protein
VSRVIEVRLLAMDSTGESLRVRLIWVEADPLIVTLDLGGIPELCVAAGRDLHIAGLAGPAGHGSVRAHPLPEIGMYTVALETCDGDEWLYLNVRLGAMTRFLARTRRVVETGSDAEAGAYPDQIDAAIAACLKEIQS